MGLDRDELAARFAVNAYTGGRDREARETLVAGAFDMADTFLGWRDMLAASKPALTPTPPPREEGAPAPVAERDSPPIGCLSDALIDTLKRDGRITINGETILYAPCARIRFASVGECWSSLFLLGKVYPVLSWSDGCPLVIDESGCATTVTPIRAKWEPCPPPPPADARGEAYKALVEVAREVEHFAKWANQPNPPSAEYVRVKATTLASEATAALSLARKAEGGAA